MNFEDPELKRQFITDLDQIINEANLTGYKKHQIGKWRKRFLKYYINDGARFNHRDWDHYWEISSATGTDFSRTTNIIESINSRLNRFFASVKTFDESVRLHRFQLREISELGAMDPRN